MTQDLEHLLGFMGKLESEGNPSPAPLYEEIARMKADHENSILDGMKPTFTLVPLTQAIGVDVFAIGVASAPGQYPKINVALQCTAFAILNEQKQVVGIADEHHTRLWGYAQNLQRAASGAMQTEKMLRGLISQFQQWSKNERAIRDDWEKRLRDFSGLGWGSLYQPVEEQWPFDKDGYTTIKVHKHDMERLQKALRETRRDQMP